jgi:hypothetical protein
VIEPVALILVIPLRGLWIHHTIIISKLVCFVTVWSPHTVLGLSH